VRITDSITMAAPVDKVYAAFHDPEVLARTLPGCESLTTTGADTYAMRVTAGVAAIRGTYDGTVALSAQEPPTSFRMKAEGAGAPGTVSADVQVSLEEAEGGTRLTYDADAIVGGMVGGVGQRMLTGVTRKMAKEFFAAVDDDLAGVRAAPAGVAAAPGEAAAAAPSVGQVFTAPARQPAAQREFLKGVAVGAALVLAGVIVGGIFGRRG
jgi:carbon monoxide dehydrogenase subunit G